MTPKRVDVEASTDAGLYYGAETLWQLIASSERPGRIPALAIDEHTLLVIRGVGPAGCWIRHGTFSRSRTSSS